MTSATNSTSETLAATGLALKTAYDIANAALPKTGGSMTGVIVFANNQTFLHRRTIFDRKSIVFGSKKTIFCIKMINFETKYRFVGHKS